MGSGSLLMARGPREASRVWVVFCFWICLLVISVCSFWEVADLYIYNLHTFLQAYCTSIKSF